jgi:hypothetical protein
MLTPPRTCAQFARRLENLVQRSLVAPVQRAPADSLEFPERAFEVARFDVQQHVRQRRTRDTLLLGPHRVLGLSP